MKLVSVALSPLLFVIFLYTDSNVQAACRDGRCGLIQGSVQRQNQFDAFGQVVGAGQFGSFGLNPFGVGNFGQFNQSGQSQFNFSPVGQSSQFSPFGGFNPSSQVSQVGQGFDLNAFGEGLGGFGQAISNPAVGGGFNPGVSFGNGVGAGAIVSQGAGVGVQVQGNTGSVFGGLFQNPSSNSAFFDRRRGQWIEPATNQPILVTDGRQIVLDQNGQLIGNVPNMLVVDSGQVINGQRVMIHVSEDSARTLLSAYSRAARNPFSRQGQIFNFYSTQLPDFTNRLLNGNSSPGVAGNGAGAGAGGVADTTAPTVPTGGAGSGSGGAGGGAESHTEPQVVETRPEGTTAEDSFWTKWKRRYEAAQFDKGKINEQVKEVLTKDPTGKKTEQYNASVFLQDCASKGEPGKKKPMTLILFTSQEGETTKTRVVVKSGHIEERQKAEVIEKAWTVATTKNGDEELGAASSKDAPSALVNSRNLSEESKTKYPGYDNVQLHLRAVKNDKGETTDFVSRQVIKHSDDKGEKRWEDNEKNDKNLFCVTVRSEPAKPSTAESDKKPDGKPEAPKAEEKINSGKLDDAGANAFFKANCISCHTNNKFAKAKGIFANGTLNPSISIDRVYNSIKDGGMPTDKELSEAEKQKILSWLDSKRK